MTLSRNLGGFGSTANVSGYVAAYASYWCFSASQLPATSNVQTFSSTGTWTKAPGNFSMVRVQMWGGGGGRGRHNQADSKQVAVVVELLWNFLFPFLKLQFYNDCYNW
jgi:hypothetical protein